MKKLAIVLVLIGIVIWALWPEPAKRWPEGILAPEPPRQTTFTDADRPAPWQLDDYRIIPLATYEIDARVLAAERYRFDREADLAPVDLLLGWQKMSDQAVVDKLSFSQRSRWGYWTCSELPIPENDINTTSANTHIIPADEQLREAVLALRPGDLVLLRGYLIEAKADDGWAWRSSLSRTDSRGSACELFWVEELTVQ